MGEAEAEAEAEVEEEVGEEDKEEEDEGTWEPVETPPEQINGTGSFRAPAACGRTGGGHTQPRHLRPQPGQPPAARQYGTRLRALPPVRQN
jgi:hypothetical protein